VIACRRWKTVPEGGHRHWRTLDQSLSVLLGVTGAVKSGDTAFSEERGKSNRCVGGTTVLGKSGNQYAVHEEEGEGEKVGKGSQPDFGENF